jgi:hypothetical protein
MIDSLAMKAYQIDFWKMGSFPKAGYRLAMGIGDFLYQLDAAIWLS